jgi:hypothetical protein
MSPCELTKDERIIKIEAEKEKMGSRFIVGSSDRHHSPDCMMGEHTWMHMSFSPSRYTN